MTRSSSTPPDFPIEPLLQVEGLRVDYVGPEGIVRAVDGVSFQINPGETLGLVGESGSGKTSVALSLLRLLPASCSISGSVKWSGREILTLRRRELRQIRGGEAGIVFQEPHLALDPLSKVLSQLSESIRADGVVSRGEARQRAEVALHEVGIADPVACLNSYPHQLSGGMLQRVVVAMALIRSPRLLIADEPTSALDTTVQARILALLRRLREARGLAMLLISHDLAVVAQLADRVAVMYSGQIVESADPEILFRDASHPYTRSLLASLSADASTAAETDPKRDWRGDGSGCRFEPSCPESERNCTLSNPPLLAIGAGRQVRCFRRSHLVEDRKPETGPSP